MGEHSGINSHSVCIPWNVRGSGKDKHCSAAPVTLIRIYSSFHSWRGIPQHAPSAGGNRESPSRNKHSIAPGTMTRIYSTSLSWSGTLGTSRMIPEQIPALGGRGLPPRDEHGVTPGAVTGINSTSRSGHPLDALPRQIPAGFQVRAARQRLLLLWQLRASGIPGSKPSGASG